MNRPNDDRSARLLTREAFRQRLEERGQTVTDWASNHGFSREQVYAFLAGRTKGKRGISHRLAIALGVKASPVDALGAPPEDSKTISGTDHPASQLDERTSADNALAVVSADSPAQKNVRRTP